MTGPAWLADSFAVVMIATAVYCAGRLVAARWWRRPTEPDVDTAHVFMGVAMAGMLVPWLNPFATAGWVAIFAVTLAWFGWQIVRAYRGAGPGGHRPGRHLPHLLASGAMLYMLLAGSATGSRGVAAWLAAAGGMAGGSARFPTLALLFALALFGYVILTTDRLASLRPVGGAAPAPHDRGAFSAKSAENRPRSWKLWADAPAVRARPRAGQPVSPRLAACCEIAMGITMGYVLIMMF